MDLPIYVTGRRPRIEVTYTCRTAIWAGQKLREFRFSYDEVEARDGRKIHIDETGIAELVALPPPNSIGAADPL